MRGLGRALRRLFVLPGMFPGLTLDVADVITLPPRFRVSTWGAGSRESRQRSLYGCRNERPREQYMHEPCACEGSLRTFQPEECFP